MNTENENLVENSKLKKHFIKKTARSLFHSARNSYREAPASLQKAMRNILIGAFALIFCISLVKYVLLKREESRRAAEVAAGPRVRVTKVTKSPGEHVLRIIGETRPYQEAILYAKVSGYLKTVKVDKGDVVKKGELLAVIESPETDQEYQAILADAKNKQAIAGRIQTLFKKNLVSQQELDQAQADSEVASSRLHSQKILKDYETIRAPFDGTVTSRFADAGALVQNATNSQASALPLVTISQINKLRVDVFVDQREAHFVEKNTPVSITLDERPGLKVEGVVSRISGQLDPRTKMLLTEIDISNDDNQLVSGSFVQVALTVKSPPYLNAPIESLVLKNNKPYLTVVSAENQLNYKPVQIADNDGKLLWIISGVQENDSVALNVGDTISEGGKVRPIVEENTSTTVKAPHP